MGKRIKARGKFQIYSSLIITLLLLIFLVVNCSQPFSFQETLDGPEGEELTINPPSSWIEFNETITFQVEGGYPPYTYELITPINGPGENLADGTYTAPSTTGTAKIQVTDSYEAMAIATVEVISVNDIVTNVDYTLSALNDTSAVHIGGELIDGDFTLTNIGTSDGGQSVSWEVYVSTDNLLNSGDSLIDTNTTATLEAGASSAPISFSGNWPSSADTYYLIVKVAASDDVTTANNTLASGGIVITDPLAISPSVISLLVGGSAAFAGSGGTPGYTYSISTSGSGTPLIDVDGAYIAGNIPGTDTVRVTDSLGATADADVTVTDIVTNVDYTLSALNDTSVTHIGRDAITGNFTLLNSGSAAGGQTVTWEVYVSTDNLLSAGDSLINTATTAALGAGPSSAPIAFSGNWPDTAATYYLIVNVTASDDVTTANNTLVSLPIAVSAPDIDYQIDPATFPPGGINVLTGSAISENFSIGNIGTSTGVDTIYWTAYVSANDILVVGMYNVIDSGTGIALNGGDSSPSINFTGNWPVTSGDYFLIVDIFAEDDSDIANNSAASAAYTVNDPDIDYIVTTGSITTVYDPADGGSAISESFTITNSGANDGSTSVYWTAYISTDNLFNAGDIPVDSGLITALAAGAQSGAINIDSGAWPVVGSPTAYYLLVDVSASDELLANTANNNESSEFSITVPLTIDPSTISLIVGGSASFSGSGGTPGYTYSIISIGSGSPSIDADGAYIAGNTPGTDTVRVTDSLGVTADAIVTVIPIVPNVDYTLSALNDTCTTHIEGDTIDGNFTVTNSGTAAGGVAITWEVYVSNDNLIGVGDSLIETSTTATLAAGASSAPISFTGNWPAVADTYYLIVRITASDDITTANNTLASGGIVITDSVAISPSAITLLIEGSATFAGSGGTPGSGYIYSISTSNSGSPSINVASGVYIAGNTAGTDTILVTDSLGATAEATVTVTDTDTHVDYNPSALNDTSVTHIGEDAITGNFTLTNIDSAAGGETVTWEVYVSTDNLLSVGDSLIDTNTTAALGAGVSSTPISFSGNWPSTADSYYLIVKVSALDDVKTANNTLSSSSIAVSAPDVDYRVDPAAFPAGAVSVLTGSAISEDFTIENIGTSTGADTIYWTAYVSTDNTLGVGTDNLIDLGSGIALNGGDSSLPINFTGNWPVTPGNYFLIVSLFAGDDSDTANNSTASAAYTVTDPDIDYIVTAGSITTVYTPANGGSVINESFTITNSGANDGSTTVYWTAYISMNNIFDPGDTPIDSGQTTALGFGVTSGAININNGAWPVVGSTTAYYLLVDVSASDELPANTANNNESAEFSITVPDIDYIVTAGSITTVNTPADGGSAINESFTITNSGADDGSTTVYWTAYISTDNVLGSGDTPVDSGQRTALASGAESVVINIDSGIWPTVGSTTAYYLFVEVSSFDEPSANTANNNESSAFSITVPDIDYIVTAGSITTVNTPANGGSAINESFTITNSGTDNGSATVYWTAYISTDNVFDPGDTPVDSGQRTALIAGVTSGAITIDSGTWPTVVSTTPYYLFVDVSSSDESSANTANNNDSSAFSITVPDIDYYVSTMPAGGTTVLIDSAISESFDITNLGIDTGKDNIYWTAYVSANNTLEIGTDTVIDSGSRASLGGTTTSPAINFTGNWPTTPGSYYLIVALSAGDDISTANNYSPSTTNYTITQPLTITPSAVSVEIEEGLTFTGDGGVLPYTFSIATTGSGSPSIIPETGVYLAGDTPGSDTIRVTDNDGAFEEATVTVTAPEISTDVNYDTVTVTNTGGTVGGGALAGEFTFTNNGTGNGTQTVDWEVFASLDTTIGVGDYFVASGTTAALAAGITTPTPVGFTGNWPDPASDYYLIVEISAIDDFVSADNIGNTTLPVTVTTPPPADIDYIVLSITNNTATSEIDFPINESFIFKNQGGDPGVNTVFWTAYISTDQILYGGDIPILTSSTTPLGASTPSGSIDITGNWPSSSGTYYLIVNVTAGDDIETSNNYISSGPFTINAPASEIDYIVSNISEDYNIVSSGSLCSEKFDLTNAGGSNGVDDITWTAYASTESTLGVGTDNLIGSGVLSGLSANSTYVSIPISGSWPDTDGEYYLIVDVSSGDETIIDNNTAYNGPFTLKDPPDYSISSANFLTEGVSGESLSAVPGDYGFTITENSGFGGSQTILWEIFTSIDTILDGDDVSIDTGSLPALTASGSSGTISFADALWPLFGSYYYVIVNISAGDDSNSANNTYVSPTTATVPEYYTEGAEDNSDIGPTGAPLTLVSDMSGYLQGATLNVDELLVVNGIMDVKFVYDTYKIVLGPSVTSLDIYAEWIGGNDIDLYLWDESSSEQVSIDNSNNTEPGVTAPPKTFTGLTPNASYYIGVRFMTIGQEGTDYSLIIQGRP